MIRRLLACPDCDNRLTRTQTVLGWIYLPVHFLLLPLLAGVYLAVVPDGLSVIDLNLLVMGVSMAFVLIVMGQWLRRCFDVLLDNPGRCALCLAIGGSASYTLMLIVNLSLLLLGDGLENPNNESIALLAGSDYGAMLSFTVFLAPLVEETLFRGVVFGTIRAKSRVAAYIVSTLLFSLAHVWQYALVYLDPRYFIYMLQYVPLSLVLNWQYERSGSIWTPTAYHMLNNALSFYLMAQL